MWWSERLRSGVLLAVAIGLSGCGFESVYGTKGGSGDPTVETELARIDVAAIKDREGQILRNHLFDLLTPKGRPAKPAYKLVVRLRISEQRLGVTASATATRANLWIDSSFSLKDPAAGKGSPIPEDEGRAREDAEDIVSPGTLVQGSRHVVASYNILANDFSTVRARQDALERGLLEAARDIHSQISVHFAQRAKMSHKGPSR
ncbi:MAG: LPS assembly lipoprotein LptE [Magnetospirillum sp. WYHS-4]